MNWEQAVAEIESAEFDARINVVSGMHGFLSAAGQQKAVIALYREMRSSGRVAEALLGRIYDMARLSVDLRYENPKDTAMAVLLWLMQSTQVEYAALAAQYVDKAQQCWYAKKFARAIMFPKPVASGDSWIGDEAQTNQATAVRTADGIISLQPFSTGQRPEYAQIGLSTLSTAA